MHPTIIRLIYGSYKSNYWFILDNRVDELCLNSLISALNMHTYVHWSGLEGAQVNMPICVFFLYITNKQWF
jgi:hypothetical protein